MIVAPIVRPEVGNGTPSISESWPVKDIVYVSVVGTIMLAAFLEWFLWLAAFLYCLVKVFQKAEDLSSRIMAVIMMILFTLLRAIFLPVMIVTLPLPSQVTQHFPQSMVTFLQWFAFWSFAGLLTIPWLFCVYQLVTHSLGRSKRVKTVLDEASAPKVVIVMPCYKEVPEVLLRTVDSLVECEYPQSCIHIFLSFDGDQEDELYLNTIEKLGVPLTLNTYPKSIDVQYRSTRITVSRFAHGGKRSCQKKTFKLMDKIYMEYLKRHDNLFVLFIDSDCILDRNCIQNFMYEMELKPGSKRNMLAMTGVITSTTEKNTLITLLQDMEYIHGQLFERSVESGCGAVTCLPGALTILRFSAFRKMAKYYFADKAEQCDDLFDYGKCHLGEDRWLTHLFMIGAKERYQIQMNTGAFCKTEAVQTYKSLLKQRRRWFLGFITNEVCMLTDLRLWKRYTILCIVRFMQNTIRTTALLFFIMVISLITTSQRVDQLPVGFIAVSLGLNWALMLYFAAKLGRYKIMLYPIMFVVNPFFNWIYMVYGIFTAGQRTWGGPRADAGAADAKVSPQEAIEYAEATGDDLNIVPETFKQSAVAHNKRHSWPPSAPLQPSNKIEGRFTPAERLEGGLYKQTLDSGLTLPNTFPRTGNLSPMPIHPRESFDSASSSMSAGMSVFWPRRVESLMNAADAFNRQGQEIEPISTPDGPHMTDYNRQRIVESMSEPNAPQPAKVPLRNDNNASAEPVGRSKAIFRLGSETSISSMGSVQSMARSVSQSQHAGPVPPSVSRYTPRPANGRPSTAPTSSQFPRSASSPLIQTSFALDSEDEFENIEMRDLGTQTVTGPEGAPSVGPSTEERRPSTAHEGQDKQKGGRRLVKARPEQKE